MDKNEILNDLQFSCCAHEMSGWKKAAYKAGRMWRRIVYSLPTLVWRGQEIDVLIRIKQDKLDPTKNALGQLFGGDLHDIEQQLHGLGIGFDTGLSQEGRDWFLDHSLKGGVSIRFVGKCRDTSRRQDRPRPKLVVVND